MIEAHGVVQIAAPIEVVFDYLADARNEPRWLPGAREVAKIGDRPVGLGTRFDGVYTRAGRVVVEIVEYERPTRVTFRAHAKIVDFDDAVTLAAHDGGTALNALMQAEPRGLMKVFAPLIARTMRPQFEANWVHLKEAIERRS